jgi:hypothetical protein
MHSKMLGRGSAAAQGDAATAVIQHVSPPTNRANQENRTERLLVLSRGKGIAIVLPSPFKMSHRVAWVIMWSNDFGELPTGRDSLHQPLPFQRFDVLFDGQSWVLQVLALLLGG